MEVTVLNLRAVLLLTILTVSVDSDILHVLYVLDILDLFIVNAVYLCLCSLSARFS